MIDLHDTKKWLNTWAKAAPELRGHKRRELADPDYYEKKHAILDGMLDYAVSHPTGNRVCGLIEQQLLFKKLFSLLHGRAKDA